MKKVIKEGMVAVLYSPGYGAGWYSWHDQKALLFHPEIVKLVQEDKRNEITEELCQKLLNTTEYICVGGASQLKIKWLKEGTAFKIDDYDGSETIETMEDINLIA